MSATAPCKTPRYAISQSKWYDVIYINSSQGPYTVSNHRYINISHSLTLTSVAMQRAAILDCGGGTGYYKLLNFTSAANRNKTPTLTLINIVIKNCKPNKNHITDGVILMKNSIINVNNCTFTSNGIIFKSDSNLLNKDACKLARLSILNSSFSFNVISKPFQPSLLLWGCKKVTFHMQNVHMDLSAITLYAIQDLEVAMTGVNLVGGGVKGAYLDITLASSTNQITLQSCTVTNHTNANRSPISIAANRQPEKTPNVHLNSVYFAANTHQRTNGGALSIYAPFDPVFINVKMSGCQFINNSATTGGGAVYLYNVDTIRMNQCVFTNNQALNGGAVMATKTSTLSFTNSQFVENMAVPHGTNQGITFGGALHLSHGKTLINSCYFTNNTASMEGAALYGKNMSKLSIQQSVFVSQSGHQVASIKKCTASIVSVSYDTGDQDMETPPPVQISHSMFNVSSTTQCAGAIEIDALMRWVYSSLQCDVGNQLQRVLTKGILDYRYLVTWCSNCPNGTYSLHGGNIGVNSSKFSVTNNTCTTCPDHGLCQKGNIRPTVNYWGYKQYTAKHNASIKFAQCPSGYCCQEEQHCLHIDSCHGNRTGTLCGQCIKGYHLTTNRNCIAEKDCAWQGWLVLTWVVCAAIYAILMFYRHHVCLWFGVALINIKSYLYDQYQNRYRYSQTRYDDSLLPDEDLNQTNGHDQMLFYSTNQTSQTEINVNPGTLIFGDMENIIKVVMYFQQMAPVIYHLAHNASIKQHTINEVQKDIFFLRPVVYVFTSLCSSHQLEIYLWWILGGCYSLSLIMLVLAPLVCCHGNRKVYLAGGLVSCVVFTYASALQATAALVHCVPLGGAHVLFYNGNISCYQPWQYGVMVYMIVCLVPLPVALYVGAKLLQQSKISTVQFVISAFIPLPFILFWLRHACTTCTASELNETPLAAKHTLAVVHGTDMNGDVDTSQNREARLALQRLLLVWMVCFSINSVSANLAVFVVQVVILLYTILKRPATWQLSGTLDIILNLILATLAAFNMAANANILKTNILKGMDVIYIIATYIFPVAFFLMVILVILYYILSKCTPSNN